MYQLASIGNGNQFYPVWQTSGPLIERARLEARLLLQMQKLDALGILLAETCNWLPGSRVRRIIINHLDHPPAGILLP
jgi:hypothetical protein